MTTEFSFQLLARDGKARRGEITMPRGTIRTPAFMPVGTGGTVKTMYMDQVRALGSDIILGNTYHLMLRPGAERVARLGGLHEFARWPYPILTDSGGFQVMSLAQLRKINESGVTFRSHIDGAPYEMSPERSIEIQSLLELRHSNAARRMHCIASQGKRDRARDGAFAALGGTVQDGVW